MISLELKNAYNNLDIDNKRNKLCDELLMSAQLLKNIENVFEIIPNFTVKNYDINSFMNEEEFLSFIYEDIFELQKQLLLIVNKINVNQFNK